jgi:hypothetical protein
MLIAGVWLLLVFSFVFATVLWALLETRDELERGWSVYGPRYGSQYLALPSPSLPESARARVSPEDYEHTYYHTSTSQGGPPGRRGLHQPRDRRYLRSRGVDRQESHQRALQAFSGP